MRPQPIGVIRKTDLRDTLTALALARPDLAEALALVAVGTGLGEQFRLPSRREQWARLVGEVEDEN